MRHTVSDEFELPPSVLVLDDDVEALEEIEEILELDDISCVGASNISDAEQALKQFPSITAVVTDVHLRQKGGASTTGVEFIGQMRDQLGARAITYIVLSGDPSAIVSSIESGAVDFLTKPLVPEDLLRAIRTQTQSNVSDVLIRKVEETTKSLQKANIGLAERDLELSANQEDYERRRIMGGKLRQGLADGHLEPWFQPQICMNTGKILGFEALVRWNDPSSGLQNPAEFLPLAQEIGLMGELDAAVQRQAFENLKALHNHGIDGCDVGINLTPEQLRDPDLVETMMEQIAEAGLRPQDVSIEILESTMLDDSEALPIKANIEQISALGVQVELDDFGTGHAGLSSLRDLDVSRIKIDRSFVTDIHIDQKLQTFTRALIGLAKTLGVGVLAEGVETREELDWLRTEGCDAVQGYFISKPMPYAQAMAWAEQWQPSDERFGFAA